MEKNAHHIFFPQGLKITAKVYIEVLETHVLPWLKRTYPQGNYIFQQDSAPAHKAKITHKFMDDNFAEYFALASILAGL